MTARRMLTALTAPLMVVLAGVAGCSATGHPTGGVAPRPSTTLTTRAAAPARLPALTPATLLGTRFLVPSGWSRAQVLNSRSNGYVRYTGGGGESVYVDVNDCSACVDQGLVTSGVANGVPDPASVLTQERAQAVRRRSATRFDFTVPAAAGQYPTEGLLAIAAGDGVVTGYAVVEVTLPAAQRAVALRIADSLTVPTRIGTPS